MYFPSLANGSLWFLSKLFWIFGRQFFSPSVGFWWMGWRLRKICFVGDFPCLEGVVSVLSSRFYECFCWTTLLYFSLFVTSCHWVCTCWNLAKSIFFRCSWNFGQSFSSNWISFSTRDLYLLSWLIGFTLHATEAWVFSPMQDPIILLASRKLIFLLCFMCYIFFSFLKTSLCLE